MKLKSLKRSRKAPHTSRKIYDSSGYLVFPNNRVFPLSEYEEFKYDGKPGCEDVSTVWYEQLEKEFRAKLDWEHRGRP